MPEFQTLDVYTSGHRHLIVYTQQQLDLLSQARTWFMDGTTIHGPSWAAHEASTIGILLHVEGEEGGLLSGKYGISINFYSVQCQHYCQPINVF